MNGRRSEQHEIVTLTERGRAGRRYSLSLSNVDRRDITAGEVIVAHWRVRVVVALAVAALQLLVLASLGGALARWTSVAFVTVVAAAYVFLVSGVRTLVSRQGSATRAVVTATLVGDLAFIFCLTIAATTPDHYARALFGTIVVVHVANFFFGRRQAWRVVQIGIGGYIVLVASAAARGLHVDVAEELWTLVLCAAGLVLIVLQAGDVRRRLRTIVRLFEHAEDGDFSHEYDAAADGRPDAITRVGLAYNGVRAQLASMVLTDPLTGCLNRRGFDQALAREVARAARAGSEFALLAIDLDHFKMVNDTYGHLAGDVVLRSVGALLTRAGRAGDVVARVGGEEFAILLADTSGRGAHLFATRLGERIRSNAFDLGEHYQPVFVTTSIGVAVGAPNGVGKFAELLWARADDALYEAKRANRDCVVLWSEATRPSGEHVAIGAPSPGADSPRYSL